MHGEFGSRFSLTRAAPNNIRLAKANSYPSLAGVWFHRRRRVCGRCGRLLSFSLAFTALGAGAEAQTYSVLHRFDATDGYGPAGRLLWGGGTLYGTTLPGSASLGAMFKLGTDGSAFTNYRFNDGADPHAGLVMSGTRLYGTARDTSFNPYGAVFALNTDGTGYTIPRNFNLNDGAYPMAELALVDSTLYGTTYQGGTAGDGTVFKINTDGTGFQLMRSFSGGDGNGPEAPLVVSGAYLFGTTSAGGDSNHGTIFKIHTNSASFSVLKRFQGVDGANPQGLLVSGSSIYGVTSVGGTFNRGTLFRIHTDGTGFAILKHFIGPEGHYPVGSLVQFDNTLYGVTYYGGLNWVEGSSNGYGTLFRMEPDGSGFYVLHSFAPPDGATPNAGLTLDGQALYGTTQSGGSPNYGMVFSFTLPRIPWIILAASNQVAAVGSTVSFSTAAIGGRPMQYQWLFNGTNLLQDTTNSTLQLRSLSFSNAGNYSVVVTNIYGSATSSPAYLRIVQASIVTNSTEADLRAAMAAGGAVRIACSGTINLDHTIEIATSTALDASGQQVTINGGDHVQVFRVNTNVMLSLTSLIVANGRSTNGAGGAGIQVEGGTLNVQGVTFLSNITTNPASAPTNMGCGGAILNQHGTLNATNCAFVQNAAENGPIPTYLGSNGVAATALGGAICNSEGIAYVEDCTFISNRVVAGAWQLSYPDVPGLAGIPARGGAVYSSGRLALNRCAFVANSAMGGSGGTGLPSAWIPQQYPVPGGDGGPAEGGAVSSVASLKIWNSLLCTNVVLGGQGGAGGGGYGGPFAWGSSGSAGGTGGRARAGALFSTNTIELVNCTFAWNQAIGGRGGDGGGGGWGINQGTGQTVYWGGGPGGSGGSADNSALFSTNSVAGVTNCTLAFNSGSGGAGGQGGGGQPPGGPGASGTATAALRITGGVLVNTLVATNTPANFAGAILDAGHNLSSDSSGFLTNSTSLLNADPRLLALADNGGPTLTMALAVGSPAIDTGDTPVVPATDQRGFPRPVGAAADIGAFEYGSPAFLQVVPTAGIGVDILATGVRGEICSWLTSTNLGSWIPLATNQFGPNGTILLHTPALDERRYFRLMLPP